MDEPHSPPGVVSDEPPLVVVRGGTFTTPEGLRAAYQNAGRVHHAYGRFGLCVVLGVGMTLRAAVLSRPLRNPQLSLTTADRLDIAGFAVSPEPGSNRDHAGILWLPDRDPDTFNQLAQMFDVVDSPFTPEERRAL